MEPIDNPYQPPTHSGDSSLSSVANPIGDFYTAISVLCFWVGLAAFILGSCIDFYPGEESIWFLTNALLFVPGVFLPKRAYRTAAIIALTVCLLLAYAGYRHGIDYQEWHRTQPSRLEVDHDTD